MTDVPPMVTQQPLGSTSKTLEVMRILAWPVTIIVLLFWSPIHRLIDSVPDLLTNSHTIAVGKLSLRIDKDLSERANQDVRDALSGMTSADVRTVMENDVGSEPTLFSGGNFVDYAQKWDRLGRLGVVRVLTKTELTEEQVKEKEKDPYVYGVVATATYDRLRKFLFGVVSDLVAGDACESCLQNPQK
jgi:hypothetical protein